MASVSAASTAQMGPGHGLRRSGKPPDAGSLDSATVSVIAGCELRAASHHLNRSGITKGDNVPLRQQEPEKKKPPACRLGVSDKNPDDDLLSHGRPTLPSALLRFTSEFGMGSGGSTTLISSGRRLERAGEHGCPQGTDRAYRTVSHNYL